MFPASDGVDQAEETHLDLLSGQENAAAAARPAAGGDHTRQRQSLLRGAQRSHRDRCGRQDRADILLRGDQKPDRGEVEGGNQN